MNEARKQKQREYARRYYEEHKEELRKKKNEYRKNNLEKYRKNQKKYYQNNKDYYNNYSKEWSKQKQESLYKKLEAYENMRKEAIECLNIFSVDKSFSFPLMKRWEENQVKSSIDYEFNDTLKKDLLNILNKVGEDNE